MSEVKRVFKNLASMAISTVLPNILNLVLIMIVARILLNSGLNDFNAVISYVTMFAVVSDFGMSGILVRDIVRNREKTDSYFHSYLTLRLITTTLMTGLACVVVNFLPYEPHIRSYVYVAAVAVFFFQVGQIFCALFQARERMELTMYGTLAYSAVYFCLGVAFTYQGMGVPGLIYANLISSVVMAAVYGYLARPLLARIRLSMDRKMARYIVIASIPFALNCILTQAYNNLDWFLISLIKYGDIANYKQPFTLVASLSFITTAYIVTVFPLFSRISDQSGNIRYACEKSIKYLFAIMIPACVGTTLLADRIVYTLWGDTFSGAILVLQILIWMTVATSINAIGGTLLNATHREGANVKNLVISMALSLALNLLLIPRLGAVGSSIVCVLTLGVYAGLTVFLLRHELRGIRIFAPLLRITVASAAMGVVIILVPVNNLFLYVGMGMLVYAIAFVLVGGISREDIELVKNVVGKPALTEIKKA